MYNLLHIIPLSGQAVLVVHSNHNCKTKKSVKGHFMYLELCYFEYFYRVYFHTLNQRHPAHFLFPHTPFKGSLNQKYS